MARLPSPGSGTGSADAALSVEPDEHLCALHLPWFVGFEHAVQCR